MGYLIYSGVLVAQFFAVIFFAAPRGMCNDESHQTGSTALLRLMKNLSTLLVEIRRKNTDHNLRVSGRKLTAQLDANTLTALSPSRAHQDRRV